MIESCIVMIDSCIDRIDSRMAMTKSRIAVCGVQADRVPVDKGAPVI